MTMQDIKTKDVASAVVAALRPTATAKLTATTKAGNAGATTTNSNATDALESMIETVVAATLYALRSVGQKDAGLAKGVTVVELGPQETADFPTWTFWGTTHCTCENIGPVSTTMGIQVGAGHEDIYVTPAGTDGSIRDIPRQWAGFRLFVTNTSQNPQSRVRVTVR